MIQLIPEGPEIPEELEQDLRNDKLVFFCGAGISINNNLPAFNKLVETVCNKLNIDINNYSILKEAKKKKDYDGILDILEGNEYFSPEILRKTVIDILSNDQDSPEIHKALLDLSSLSNKKGYRLVTTNFDRLFFKARPDLKYVDSAPKLQLPRKETWKNLTFLHGVIDKEKDPEGKNLILTKKDFGLAYLHDNWTARFIIQLFQDFTILFIGYSMDDPVMKYLLSSIRYEKGRRKQEDKNFAYAFAKYQDENKWKYRGITPIPYTVKENDNHSLLYDTIKKWAEFKNTGLIGRKIWLKNQLNIKYTNSDKSKAKNVTSVLKIDKKLAEYFPKIDLSIEDNRDSKKTHPVCISWLKALDEQKILNKLTCKTAQTKSQKWYPMWEPLNNLEENIIEWLLQHLDKKELISWVITKGCFLHPYFKQQIRFKINSLENNTNNHIVLNNHILKFWNTVISNSYNSEKNLEYPYNDTNTVISLNQNYCPAKMQYFLEWLEPYIEFSRFFNYHTETAFDEKIYEPHLKIIMKEWPYEEALNNETALLTHAEDFTNLLKKAMETAKYFEIIKEKNSDPFFMHRPSIADHEQNRNYKSWIYLINLTRDSFDLAMEKDKNLANLLLNRWKLYPYSIFYRLILYAVTKYCNLNEETALNLLKQPCILWSASGQNEVFKYLKIRTHSKSNLNTLLSLIIKGPPSHLFKEKINAPKFDKMKEIEIFYRLRCLKKSDTVFPKDVEELYNTIQKKYSMQLKVEKDDQSDFPFFHSGISARWGSDTKDYNNFTAEEIYNDLKTIESDHFPEENSKENGFRKLVKQEPDKAFTVIKMFSNKDIERASIYGTFIYTISEIQDIEKSNKYFLEALKKLDNFKDVFLKKILWSLVYSLYLKAGPAYHNNIFKKWWNRLWKLSIESHTEQNLNRNFYHNALNSLLGRLSNSIFTILWNILPEKTPRKKIPEEIKPYFKSIIKVGRDTDPAILSFFGVYLWHLWHLDNDWVIKNIKPLMHKQTNQNIWKALWEGYSYRIIVSPDFIIDFKDQILDLILHNTDITGIPTNKNTALCETVAEILFITTGGKWMNNIFNDDEEKKQIVQATNKDILESLSRKVWNFLKDSDKPEDLWKTKIKSWIKNFWPLQNNRRNVKIIENLCLIILYCGQKMPDAFTNLQHIIINSPQPDDRFMVINHITRHCNEKLQHIFDYPNELLKILDLNLPADNTLYSIFRDDLKNVLEKLKNKHPEIKNEEIYKNLIDKIS